MTQTGAFDAAAHHTCMTQTGAFDAAAHPRASDGKFATKTLPEAKGIDLGAGALGANTDQALDVGIEPTATRTHNEPLFAALQATDAFNRAARALGGVNTPEQEEYRAQLDATLGAYVDGEADRASTALRLSELANRASTAFGGTWTPATDYLTEHLERVGALINGSRPYDGVSCPTCMGMGERATGRVDYETGAPDLEGCTHCGGTGYRSNEAFEADMGDEEHGIEGLTFEDRWSTLDPEQAPSTVRAREAAYDRAMGEARAAQYPWPGKIHASITGSDEPPF